MSRRYANLISHSSACEVTPSISKIASLLCRGVVNRALQNNKIKTDFYFEFQ